MKPQQSQFKSAEEWIDGLKTNPPIWHDEKINLVRNIQSNAMREAARIVSKNNWPDYMVEELLEAANAIEKGEYKPNV